MERDGSWNSEDLRWLVEGCLPKKDLLGSADDARALIDKVMAEIARIGQVEAVDTLPPPKTFALLGGWGAGKTSVLALAARELESKGQDDSETPFSLIYFNAWKHAGQSEILPALLYRILNTRFDDQSDPVRVAKAARIVWGLCKHFSSEVGALTEAVTGVNVDVAKVAKSIAEAKEKVDGAVDPWAQKVKTYATRADRTQELLQSFFKVYPRPCVVIIDELDRCDPGEAFEVVKQLRVLFAMHGLPVVFVLSFNPEPIGLAIRHQYGLGDDYEATRIMEKYYDEVVVDLSRTRGVLRFVQAAAGKAGDEGWLEHTMRFPKGRTGSGAFASEFGKGCRLLTNLRMLEDAARAASAGPDELFWPKLHISLLRRIDRRLAVKVAMLARPLGQHAVRLQQDEAGRGWSSYRKRLSQALWSFAQAEASNKPEVSRALREMLNDPDINAFLASMTLVGEGQNDLEGILAGAAG